METCDVCRGRQIIRLPLYRKIMTAPRPSVDALESRDESFREYPCPECGPVVGAARVAILHGEARAVSEYAMDPEFQVCARRDIARNLADFITDSDLVRFGEWVKDSREGICVLRGTVGVVAPNVVAEMEQRIAERQAEKAEEMAQHLLRQVSNWGSEYGSASIDKSVLQRFIRDAVKAVTPA